MPFLRQSTSQVVLFGPCLDKTDGVTEETGLTLAQADMQLSKDGGSFAQKNASGNATHDSDGWYATTLDTTDTATVGELIMNVHQPANMLPVWSRYWIIEEAVYDAHYGAAAAGPLQSTTAARTLDVTAAGEAGIDLDNTSGTLDAAQIGADAITAAKIADGAIDAATFAAGAIDAAAIATDAVDKIVGHLTGTADSGTTTTLVDAARTEADTDYWKGSVLLITSGTIAGQIRRIASFTPASDTITVDTAFTQVVSTNTYTILKVAYNEAPAAGSGDWTTAEKEQIRDSLGVDGNKTQAAGGEVQDIKTKTDSLTFSTASRVDSQVFGMETGTLTAAAIATDAITAAKIAADAIGASELATDAVEEIADAVWNEDATAHQTGGTFGQAIGDPGANTETMYDAVVTDAAGTNVSVDVVAVKSDTAAILTDTGTTIPGTITTLQADTDDIQTRLPAALVSGAMDSDVSAIQAGAITAAAIATDAVDADALATDAVDEIADGVWDEVLTGATHNVVNSGARRLRDLQEFGVYEGGAVWIDTVNGSAGTTDFESGTAFNPVNTIADANTIAASLGLVRFRVAPGSTITFAASQANESFEGHEWTLALGGQNIAGTEIVGATISGTGTGSGYILEACSVGVVTLADGEIRNCGLAGTFTASAASDYYFDGCFSRIAGSGSWIFDFGAAVVNTNLNLRHHSGGITINNKDNTGTDLMSVEGHGQLVVAASSGGAISLRGGWDVTNTGGASITYDDLSQNAIDILGDTDDIQTRIPVALVDGAMDSDVSAMQSGIIQATTFAADAIDAAAVATDAIDADALATDAVNEIRDTILPVKNAAFPNIPVFMVLTSDHVTGSTGLSLGVTRSIDGGAFGAGTGTAAEISIGAYQYDASSDDMNGTMILFRFTGTSSDDTFVVVRTTG